MRSGLLAANFKRRLPLEEHLAKTLAGLDQRIAQRLLWLRATRRDRRTSTPALCDPPARGGQAAVADARVERKDSASTRDGESVIPPVERRLPRSGLRAGRYRDQAGCVQNVFVQAPLPW
jgi:hypothetical protein